MGIKSVFIVGAGLMGCGIAQVAAEGGYAVVLNDVNGKTLCGAREALAARWARNAAKGRITPEQQQEYLSRLSLSEDYQPAKDADLIIEAVYESLETKSSVLTALSKVCKPSGIIASNTSSISLTALSSFVSHKERFIGMHFFSPVPVMRLLEIVPALCTSAATVSAVQKVGEAMNKKVIVAQDAPGFIVNRMLDLMLNEAVQILDEGAGDIEDIDAGMKLGCNHPMGPLELIDFGGVDILLAVMEEFYRRFGDPKYRPSLLLRKMVESGFLGRKSGAGFYLYDGQGTKLGVNPALNSDSPSKD